MALEMTRTGLPGERPLPPLQPVPGARVLPGLALPRVTRVPWDARTWPRGGRAAVAGLYCPPSFSAHGLVSDLPFKMASRCRSL